MAYPKDLPVVHSKIREPFKTRYRSRAKPQERLNALLSPFADAITSELYSEECPIDFIICAWGHDEVGKQGQELFGNCQSDDDKGTLSVYRVGDSFDENKESTSIRTYRQARSDRKLPSLSELHEKQVTAGFWLFGRPNETPPISYATLDGLIGTWKKHLDERDTKDIRIPFLNVLAKRYFNTRSARVQKDKDNLYFIPKYGVGTSDPDGTPPELHLIVGFKKFPNATPTYASRACNLLADLLVSYAGNHLKIQAAAREAIHDIDYNSLLHNLRYAQGTASSEAAMRYFLERLAYTNRRSQAAVPVKQPFALGDLERTIRGDQPILHQLIQNEINATLKITPFIAKGLVSAPFGSSAVNAVRAVLENVIRNFAKHADLEEREFWQGRDVPVHLRVEENGDRYKLSIIIPDRDKKSFNQLCNKYDPESTSEEKVPEFWFLNDKLERLSHSQGILENLMNACLLRFVPPIDFVGTDTVQRSCQDSKLEFKIDSELYFSIESIEVDGISKLAHVFYLDRQPLFEGETALFPLIDSRKAPLALCLTEAEIVSIEAMDSPFVAALTTARAKSDNSVKNILVAGKESKCFTVKEISVCYKRKIAEADIEMADMVLCHDFNPESIEKFDRTRANSQVIISGYKIGWREYIEGLESSGSSEGSFYSSLLYLTTQLKVKILVLDERSQTESLSALDRSDVVAGISGNHEAVKLWKWQEVDIPDVGAGFGGNLTSLKIGQDINDYDVILAHDGLLRKGANSKLLESMKGALGEEFASKVIIHSSAGQFQFAQQDDLYTQDWSLISGALRSGDKAALVQLCRAAIRYSKRSSET